jgi:hypothetical protein
VGNNILTDFQQQEAEATARMLQLNRWSLVMIEVMIAEQEQKLLASDLPVDDDTVPAAGADFWEELT